MQDQLQLEQKVAENYWIELLKGAEVPDLWFEPNKEHGRISLRFDFPIDTYTKILERCQYKDINLFKVLLSAFLTTVGKYDKGEQVLVATPLTHLVETPLSKDQLIYFRFIKDPSGRVKDLLDEVHRQLTTAHRYYDIDVDVIHERLGASQTAHIKALHHLLFSLDSFNKELDEDDTSALHCRILTRQGKPALLLTCDQWFYSTAFATLFARHYFHVLDQMTAGGGLLISDIELLDEEEKTAVLSLSKGPAAKWQGPTLLHGMFEAQAALTPDAIAMATAVSTFTYQEINDAANQRAWWLKDHYAIKPDHKIAILLPKSPEYIIWMLSILKSGAAFIPVDPEYPEDRIRHSIVDSGTILVVSERRYLSSPDMQQTVPAPILCIEEHVYDTMPKGDLPAITRGSDLAYIIYTSGSTGKPKGVMLEHASVANTIYCANELYAYSAADKVLQFTSVTFDVSICDIFCTFSVGAALLLVEKEMQHDIDYFRNFMETRHATAISINPNLLYLVDEDRVGLRLINSGGESPDPAMATKISRRTLYFNSYGPTEAAIFCAVFGLAPSPEEPKYIPIGRPLANMQILIVDPQGNPLPQGFTGELAIGGIGLARGYVNNPSLTDQVFVDHPVDKGEKLYLSGDFGKYLPDGQLLYIGRKDQQVKIAGHRIELGEIEHAIRTQCGIQQLFTLVRKDKNNLSHIIVYFVHDHPLGREAFDQLLRRSLPEFMIPSFYMQLKHFPLNFNGKIDAAALPDPFTVEWTNSFAPARNPLEERLVDIWEQLLSARHFGIEGHFFRLGGNSILASQMLAKVHKEYLCKVDFRRFFKTPTIAFLSAEIEGNASAVPYEPIGPAPEASFYTLSYAQQRLWVLCQFEKDSIAYNMPMTFLFRGQLNREFLAEAIQILVQRHESLRTVFELVEGEPRQRILPYCKAPIEHIDLSGLTEADKTKKMNEVFTAEAHRPFDLEKGPLLKFISLLLDVERCLIIFNIHHIINDGWSYNIIIREVSQLYNSMLQGIPAELRPLRLQYKDYSEWNRSCVETGRYAASETYWLDKFRDKPNGINLPLDFPRQVVQTFNGGRIPFQLPAASATALRNICRDHGSTFFMGLLSLVKIALYRFSGQQDIMLGSPIAGREHPELHDMIGFLVNTLVYRTHIHAEDTFIDILEKVSQDAIDSFTHQDYPFDLLIEKLNLTRDLSQSPLFNVMLAHNNTETVKAVSIKEAKSDYADLDDEFSIAKFDLLFFLDEDGDKVFGELEYNSDLFKRTTAQRILMNFIRITEAVVTTPDKQIRDLDLSSSDERSILDQFAFRAINPIRYDIVQEYFEAQTDRTPDRIAVSLGDRKVSYRELDELSNRLARYLHQAGVRRKDVLGICIQRSPEMIVAILGTLKAGAAYLGVDPAYPVHRVTYMLADSKVNLVISDDHYGELFDGYNGRYVNIQDDILPLLDQYDHSALEKLNGPQDIAYVIYTSGSTGTPNGAMLSHGILSNLIDWQLHHSGIDNHARSLQFTSINFCVSFQEIFITLAAGGSIHLIGELERKDIGYLCEFIEDAGIENVYLPFSFLNFLLQEEHRWNEEKLKVRHIITAGEQLKISRGVRSFLARHPDIKMHNHYGSSEMHVVTAYTLDATSIDAYVIPPAGKPIQNTRILILEESGNLAPIGVFGEIHVQSLYPVSGYINSPQLNERKFVSVKGYDGIFYRTGDIGRWLDDGNIELQGRKDAQLKIRGFRVELGEIESKILSYNGVRETVVVVRKDRNEQDFLVAYVAMETPGTDDLRHFLQQYLPNYMMPQIVLLPALPLMPNGKVDRQQLPEITAEWQSLEYKAPETALQKVIGEIWQEVLAKEKISINDNFFEAGGHSIKATQVISRIQKRLGIKPDLRDLFLNPTIRELSAVIQTMENEKKTASLLIEPAPQLPHYPISHGQHRLWILDQMNPGMGIYNIPAAYIVKGKMNKTAFRSSFETLIHRHESLRTVFRMEAGEVRQFILDPATQAPSIEFSEMTGEDASRERLHLLADEEANRHFDLSHGPLFRIRLIDIGSDQHLILYTLHHIISDGWSMKVIISELMALYRHFNDGSPLSLTSLPFQYKDYAYWQREHFMNRDSKSRKYWMNLFADGVPLLDFPADHQRPPLKTYRGGLVDVLLKEDVVNRLGELAQREGCSMFMICLTLVKTLLYKYAGQEDTVIGTPVAGRGRIDLESQIGFYVNTICLRSSIQPDWPLSSCLHHVRQLVLNAFEHDEYPFDKLVDDLDLPRDISRSPLFDVMLTYTKLENDKDQPLRDLLVRSFDQEYKMSKFDLSFDFVESNGHIDISIEYAADLFDEDRMQRVIGHLEWLSEQMATDPSQRIQDLSLLRKAEQLQLLQQFNGNEVEYPLGRTLPALFARQVAERRASIALEHRGRSFSFGRLDELSSQLAHYLNAHYAIQPEDLIGVSLQRSEWLVISLLGVLKTGAAYVPVDPAYPAERLAFLKKDGNWKVCIDDKELEQFLWEKDQYPTDAMDVSTNEHQLAYVIYTSGSTGQPKGCMLEHKAVVNRLEWMWREFGFDHQDVILQKTTLTFDVSVWEFFLPLCWGCKMVLCEEDDLFSLDRMARLIATHQVTCLHFVPGMLGVFMSELFRSEGQLSMLSSLKRIITSGEALPAAMVDNWYSRMSAPLYNLYGPTEAAIDVSHYKTAPGMEIVPIGKPVANTSLYIVDDHGKLLPVDVAGELCIGGIQLARGYLNRTGLTTEKFLPDPFSQLENARLYKTGDKARWLPDGNIAYLGRIDEQVKIRGYRIEPGEIESVALQSGSIAQIIVIAREERAEGIRQLIGYVVPLPEKTFDKTDLVDYLQNRLPAYMVPQLWVTLESFPLTASGKIDKKRLPSPDPSTADDRYVAPYNKIQQVLTDCWMDLLGIARIGIHDNFFSLGGHSLLAVRILGKINSLWNITISLYEFFNRPTIAEFSDHIERTLATYTPSIQTNSLIPLSPEMPDYPLSSGQARIWITQQLFPGNYSYNIVQSYGLRGALQVDLLQTALDRLVQRYEILRTSFDLVGEEPRQRILSFQEGRISLAYQDLRQVADKMQVINELFEIESRFVFDLSKGPLLRPCVMQVNDGEWLLIINLHHIITDEWSTDILLREWKHAYASLLHGNEPAWRPLPLQYKDYAVWQQTQLSNGSIIEMRSFWLDQFQEQVPVFDLPMDHIRPATPDFNGNTIAFRFPAAIQQGLRSLAADQGSSLFMTLLPIIRILLYKYTGQLKMIIGTPVLGREHPYLEDQLGFFVNTLPILGTIEDQESFVSLLQKTRDHLQRCYAHQLYPFDRIVSDLNISRESNRNPLFDIMISYHRTAFGRHQRSNLQDHRDDQDTPSFGFQDEDTTTSKFDCTFDFIDTENGLELFLNYKTALFRPERMTRMIDHLTWLCEQIISNPKCVVGTLSIVREAEVRQIMESFNNTTAAYPADRTWIDLFAMQAALTPEAVAIVHDRDTMSYRELNERSNRLAHYLRNKGVTTDSIVGICMDRGPEMMIGLIAIGKAGAAYLPVDPTYPAERIAYMLSDSEVKITLTDEGLHHLREEITQWPAENPEILPGSGNLAYMLYTSGSTGHPKGVLIEHRSLMNFLWSMKDNLGITSSSSILAITTYCFDISCLELYLPLIAGGKIILLDREEAGNGMLLVRRIETHRPSHIQATPSTWQMLLDSGWTNDEEVTILTGGEAIGEGLRNKLVGLTSLPVWNMYGPTETTIWSTMGELRMEEKVTIGRPINNTKIYILDGNGMLMPVGIPGELYIGGQGLARGYWKRPELTAERFLPDPFSFEPGDRIYRSGDRARWLPDGNIEYLGRIDQQVKIRGYRIEPGEIEQVSLLSGLVEQVVVIACNEQVGDAQRLVGYIVAAEGRPFDKDALVDYLAERLPSYMVPRLWVELDSFPLTTNGKIDRKNLPCPDLSASGGEHTSPRNETERILVSIWQELLGITQIGIHDDFFELGGHSLLAIRILGRINRQWNISALLHDLFDHPTIADLTQQVLKLQLTGHTRQLTLTPIPTAPQWPDYPLSSGQARMWITQELFPGNYSYNIVQSYGFRGDLQTDILQTALDKLVERYEILRTRFILVDGEPRQQILSAQEGRLQITYMDLQPVSGRSRLIRDLLGTEARFAFDLTQGPLLRILVLQVGSSAYRIVINMHHIITDEWSMSILLRHWTQLYKYLLADKELPWTPLRIQYKDYALWQQTQLNSDRISEMRSFWLDQFQGEIPVLELPADHARPVSPDFNGHSISYRFSPAIQEELQSIAAGQEASLFMIMLSLIRVLLYKYTGQSQIITGMPTLGREHPDLEDQIGFFVNTLPVTGTVDGDEHFLSLLRRTREQVLKCYANQLYPFDLIVNELDIPRENNRNPLFDVMVSYHHIADPAFSLKPGRNSAGPASFELTEEDTTAAKFDCTFALIETEEGLELYLNYKTALFKPERMTRMIGHLDQLCRQVAEDPLRPVKTLSVLNGLEKQQLLEGFNATSVDYPRESSIVDLWEQQVDRTPDAVALVEGDVCWSFRELDQRATKLAGYLQEKGVEIEDRIAVLVDRSAETVLSILAVLKAGGAFVPIDPSYPAERIAFLLEDAACTMGLGRSLTGGPDTSTRIPDTFTWVNVSEDWPRIAACAASLRDVRPLPENLAYVIYTSGSTGRPKGVLVEHHALIDHIYGGIERAGLDICRKFALTASLAADGNHSILFSSLLLGRELHVLPEELILDGRQLHTYLSYHQIDCIKMVPSHWLSCAEGGAIPLPQRVLILGGETFPLSILDKLRGSHYNGAVYNHYGPTETTIGKCMYRLDLDRTYEKVPIGRPFSNARLYILDKDQQMVPVGIPGELYIGGQGLARGYWDRPELEKEKFLPDPFTPGANARMYRTGDQCCWLPDGNMEYLGRIDEQIKIRGYRIEPGEIEQTALLSGLIDQVVVIARTMHTGEDKQLIGYVVTGNDRTFDKASLMSCLALQLPSYMVPQWWVQLTGLPLTASGKVDKKILPSPELPASDDGYTAPRNETEQTLISIWQDLLGVERIGIDDNFFKLGGHSLLAVRILGRLYAQFGITVGLHSFFSRPTVQGLAQQVISRKMTSHTRELTLTPVSTAPEWPDYPLSSGQARMWVTQELLPGNYSYNIVQSYGFRGDLQTDILQTALDKLVERYEILRTRFILVAGEPRQQILSAEEGRLQITYTDLRPVSDRSQSIRGLLATEARFAFDLAQGPLLRIHLLQVGDTAYRLVISMHHIITDEWSTAILLRHWTQAYEYLLTGKELPWPPLRIQYKDYALWQQTQLNSDRIHEMRSFWLDQFRDEVPVLELPADHARPVSPDFNGHSITYRFAPAIQEGLRSIAAGQEASLFMIMLSLIRVLLYKYTGQSQIITGMPTLGREHPDLEDQPGFFVNTLPVSGTVNGDEHFLSLLGNIREQVLKCYANQLYPFDLIVNELNIPRGNNRNPLFDVMVSYHHVTDSAFEPASAHKSRRMDSPGSASFEFTEEDTTAAKFDCSFHLIDTDDGLDLYLNYKTCLFNMERMTGMVRHLSWLCEQIVSDPRLLIKDLRLLTKEEERQQLLAFNGIEAGYRQDMTMVDLIEQQASNTPDAIALIFEGKSLTYRELDERSNQLGHYLRDKGVREDMLIPIAMDRNADMVVGMLGILKAGGAYVPVDPDYPIERIAYIMKDTGATLILTSKARSAMFGLNDRIVPVIELDAMREELSTASPGKVKNELQPDNAAYMIYTSGSTGRPKGVLVDHRNVVRLFKTNPALYDFGPDDVWTMFHSFAFDFSVWEIYGALFNGGRVIIVPAEIARDANAFGNLLVRQEVTVLNQTPSAFYTLQESLLRSSLPLKLRYVIFGGETLNPSRLMDWSQRYASCRLINMYGITETTVHVTFKELDKTDLTKGISNIGRPIPTLDCYVLDKDGNILPAGLPGELYVGGPGVTRGYLNRPELMAEKFLPNPFSSRPGTAMYRTGDRVCWMKDGNIEYLGRVDEQVKIRGYRIEPGEIEQAAILSGLVDQVIVIARDERSGEGRQLIGYAVAPQDRPFDRSSLVGWLSAHLPSYMVPQLWVELDSMPLTASGKINKKALPSPDLSTSGDRHEAPGTATEHMLIAIWQELLGIERIGINDNFFELGGHSLLAVRILGRIFDLWPVTVSLYDFFIQSTVAGLSARIDKARTAGDTSYHLPIPRAPLQEHYPLSSGQARMWMTQALFPGNYSYNIVQSYGHHAPLEPGILQDALDLLVQQYEILRTRFSLVEGEPRQFILPADQAPIQIDHHDLRHRSHRSQVIDSLMAKEATFVFDLSAGPLMHIHVLRIEDDQYQLLISQHHIITDEWSIEVLLDKWKQAYERLLAKEELQWSPLYIQYKDYAVWQQDQLHNGPIGEMRDFWLDQFREDIPVLDLPADFIRPTIPDFAGHSITYTFPISIAQQLRLISSDRDISLFMMMLSLIQVLLHKYTGQPRMVTGTPTLGREHPELQDQIGFFVNTLPVIAMIDAEESFASHLQRTKEQLLRCYAHQQYPFDRIVSDLNIPRESNRNPLFDVMVSYLHAVGQQRNGTPSISPFEFSEEDGTTSKFDCTFNLVDAGESLQLILNYKTGLFTPDRMLRMIAHLQQLCEQVIANPLLPIKKLSVLNAREEQQILEDFNITQTDYPHDKTWLDLFEVHAIHSPEAIALVCPDGILTYRELDERSNQLGHYLRGRGVGPECLVGICMDRGPEMVVGLLGILKAGGAYLPIDPSYPADRIAYLLSESRVGIVLTDGSYMETNDTRQLIIPEQLKEAITASSRDSIGITAGPANLAYVLFTSGSTGRPKGVMVERQSLTNFLYAMKDKLAINTSSKMLAVTTYSFDISYLELFLPLMSGGTVFLTDKTTAADGYLLIDQLKGARPDYMQATPSTWQMLLDCGWNNEEGVTILTGGESIGEALKNRLVNLADRPVWNMYGPTETTIWSAMELLKLEKKVSIGQPIANTRMYILDNNMQPVPIGIPGELYIGGEGLARGYINQMTLTAEKFLPDPFSQKDGARLYRTGDRACWLNTGGIEFLGRMDDQVKIHGYRIEPGEIEFVAAQSRLVEQVVVIARKETASTGKQLVGYIIPHAGLVFDRSSMIDYLRKQLPAYMVPQRWIELDSFPLTANGKIDKMNFPSPDHSMQDNVYVEPRNEVERTLAGIWEDLLGIGQIGIDDNFFALGGHSFIMIQVLGKARKHSFDLQLPDFYNCQTIREQATLIHARTGETQLPQHEHLIRLTSGSHELPIYIIPGIHGACDGYQELADFFEGTYTVYGIQMQGLWEGEEPIGSVEEIAAQNIRWIKELQPKGPYRFIGHSFGGVVLYEMVRQLERSNDTVGLATILDVSPHSQENRINKADKAKTIVESVREYMLFHHLMEDANQEWLTSLEAELLALPDPDMLPYLNKAVEERFAGYRLIKGILKNIKLLTYNFLMTYSPQQVLETELLIGKAQEEPWGDIDNALGWAAYADKAIQFPIPGKHSDMIRKPHAQALADFVIQKLA